MHPAQRGQVW